MSNQLAVEPFHRRRPWSRWLCSFNSLISSSLISDAQSNLIPPGNGVERGHRQHFSPSTNHPRVFVAAEAAWEWRKKKNTREPYLLFLNQKNKLLTPFASRLPWNSALAGARFRKPFLVRSYSFSTVAGGGGGGGIRRLAGWQAGWGRGEKRGFPPETDHRENAEVSGSLSMIP